jgi:tetratricopeptide (TPR) repeat protein
MRTLLAACGLAATTALAQSPDWKSLNADSIALYKKGDVAGAIATGTKALDAALAALGPEAPAVATIASNLARMHDRELQRPEAEALYRRTLAIREKTQGPEHLEVASALNNLAGVLREEGRYAEAEPLYARALAIRERKLPTDHPDIAASLNNLASNYRAMNKYEEAKPLYVRALEIRRKALGDTDPEVATTLNNLAAVYDAQGDYEHAESLYKLALKIREGRDPDSLETAAVLSNLAELYIAQHYPDKALPLLRHAYEIRLKSLPGTHPDLKATRHDLFAVHMNRGEFALAGQFADPGDPNITEDMRRKLLIPLPTAGMSPTRLN